MAKSLTVGDDGIVPEKAVPVRLRKTTLDASYAPQSGAGSPAAALTSANAHADDGDTTTLTTATGRAVAFSIALGG